MNALTGAEHKWAQEKAASDWNAKGGIKSADGKSTGSFSDLKTDQRVGISYAAEPGKHFAAESIDLDAPAAETKKTEPAKKKK